MSDLLTQKQLLRTRIKHQRNTLTKPFMERSAIAILGHIASTDLFNDANKVAFYLPFQGEISCWPLIEFALSQNKECFVPKVFPNQKRGMWFLPYEGKESVEQGAFGILEPTAKTSDAIRPSELDLIFLPLVAYDPQGNRLGMGGGYYDTALSNSGDNANCPQKIGLAYNFQQVSDLPCQEWDQKLDGVVTPSYFRRFNSQDD